MRVRGIGSLRSEGAALLRWWIRELREMGRQLLEHTAPRLAKQVVIEFKGDIAQVYALSRGTMSERIAISRDPSGAWPEQLTPESAIADHLGARATLVLAPEDTLRFDLLVPHALGRDLDSAIALQLERELPLAREQLGVDYQMREHLPGSGKNRVQVLVAHRSQLEDVRNRVEQWGLRPVRIRASGEDGAVVGDFLRSPFRFRTMPLSRLERRLLVAVCVLSLMLGTLVAGQWTYERIAVDEQLRRLAPQSELASSLAARLVDESTPARDLINIERVPDASDVLSALTRTIPTYAWVYRLHVDASSTGAVLIRMGAFAPPASALLSILEDTHRFGTVQLISATATGGPAGLDRLKLIASRSPATPTTSVRDSTDTTGVTP